MKLVGQQTEQCGDQPELDSLSAPSVRNQIPEIVSSGTETRIGSLKWKLSIDDESHEGWPPALHYALHHVVLCLYTAHCL